VDIDGVLVDQWQELPGSAHAVQVLRAAGVPLRFLTNTTSRSAESIRQALNDVGIEVEQSEVFTAGIATATYLKRTYGEIPCLFLNDGPRDDFEGVTIAEPEDDSARVVVIGAGGPSFSWSNLNVALRCVLAGADLIAMHGSRIWNRGGFCLDGGAYITMIEAVSGARATTVGKPAPSMFTLGLEAIQCSAEEAAMIGDDINSDVRGAQALGLTGVLVKTGKYRATDLVIDDGQVGPDFVLDRFADVPRWLSSITET